MISLAVRVILIICCAFVIFVILAGIFTGHVASDRYLALKTRRRFLNPSEEKMNELILEHAEKMKLKVDREYVLTNLDGIKLHGYLIRSGNDHGHYVFLSHSYRSREGGFEFAEKIPIWLDLGYHVFLVDHRAHGKSGGRMISFGQYESEDGLEWIDFMRKEFGEDIKIALHGQSMGAATVLMMAGRKNLPDNVKCVISDSGYTDFYSLVWSILPLPRWFRTSAMWPMYEYLRIFHHIDMKKADAFAAVEQAKVPILFLQGAKDKMVQPKMCEELYEACPAPKEKVVFPEATHIKSYNYDPEGYALAVCRFAKQYL